MGTGWGPPSPEMLCSKERFPLVLPKFPPMPWPLPITWSRSGTEMGFPRFPSHPCPLGRGRGHLHELPGSFELLVRIAKLSTETQSLLINFENIRDLNF